MFNLLDKLTLNKDILELQRLNSLWERFNEGDNVLEEILQNKWIFHIEKVILLVKCIILTNKQHN